jgi:hypothetical protein
MGSRSSGCSRAYESLIRASKEPIASETFPLNSALREREAQNHNRMARTATTP